MISFLYRTNIFGFSFKLISTSETHSDKKKNKRSWFLLCDPEHSHPLLYVLSPDKTGMEACSCTDARPTACGWSGAGLMFARSVAALSAGLQRRQETCLDLPCSEQREAAWLSGTAWGCVCHVVYLLYEITPTGSVRTGWDLVKCCNVIELPAAFLIPTP